MSPVVSIVIPVYNTSPYLTRCVESVLCQSYSDFEIILVDDGSTDDSGIIADRFAEEDKRVHVFHKNNAGVSSARNYGISYAQGEWIVFVDSDDFLSECYLETVLKATNPDTDFCLCNFDMLTENGMETYKTFQPGDSMSETLHNLFMCGWIFVTGILFKKSFLKVNRLLFPEHINYTEDVWFVTRAVYYAKSIQKITAPLYRYNCINTGSITHNSHNEKAEDIRLTSINETITFLQDHHSFEQCKKACFWRVLVWKSWVVYYPQHYVLFNLRIPEANRYIWTNPFLSVRIKFVLWLISQKLYFPAKLLISLYHR